MFKLNVANRIYFKFAVYPNGFVAQWITRLPTEQKIPGSTPGRLESFFCFYFKSRFDINFHLCHS